MEPHNAPSRTAGPPASPPQPGPQIQLRLHGLPAVRLLVDGVGDWQPLERKDAGWLAVLAMEGATPRDILAAWLWPDVPQKTANGSLRQRVFRLRRRLGHELLSAGPTLALDPAVVVVPARPESPPQDAQGAAIAATGEPASGCAEADCLSGFAYDDCPAFAAWLARQRAFAVAQRQERLDAECAALEARGELSAALERAQALLAVEPLSEHALRRTMQLHAARGDRAAAVAAFERFEQRLRDELGTRPAPPTLALLAELESAAPAALQAVSRRSLPAALQRPPRLVGRDAELAELASAWAAQRVFLVLGEAGLGKSRLLDAFAQSRPGTLSVASRPGDAGVPFAMLARLLRLLRDRSTQPLPETAARELARVLPELAPAQPASGPAQRLLLQRAVQGLLQASPVRELLLDDLHFADAASLDILQGLLADEALVGLNVGLAQRPGEGDPAAHALHTVLQESQRLHPVQLRPLDMAALAALVDSLALPGVDGAALAPQLQRHSGGNPLFALETLRELWLADPAVAPPGGRMPQPATVGALIERRLCTLSRPALALARVAALAGQDFDIALAEAVLATPALNLADPWNELEAAQVLHAGVFAHDLVFEAVCRSVPEAIACHVHGRIADVLHARHASAAARAPHLARAQRHAEAGQAWREAAAVALRAGRRTEELGFLQQAEQAWHRAGNVSARVDAQIAQIETTALVHGQPAALALADTVLQIPAAASPGALRAAAVKSRANVLQWAGRLAEAAEAAAQVLAEPAASTSTCIGAVVVRAAALATLGRAEEALALGDAWHRRVQAEGSDEEQIFFLGARIGPLAYAHRRREASAVAEEHVRLARRQGVRSELCAALGNLSVVAAPLGDLEAAIAPGREALALGHEDDPDSMRQGVLQSQLAALLLAAGAYGEALGLLEEATARLGRLLPESAFHVSAQTFLADAWMALGQRAKALSALAQEPMKVPGWVRARWLLARARAMLGGPGGAAAAVPLLQTALPLCEGPAGEPTALFVRLQASAALEPHDAADVCQAIAQRAAEVELPVTAVRAALCRLQALQRGGQATAAQAMSLHQQAQGVAGPGLYGPEVAFAVAQVLGACGEKARALDVARAGLAWIDTVALPQVPSALREAFLQRNPVNAALRALAAVTRQ